MKHQSSVHSLLDQLRAGSVPGRRAKSVFLLVLSLGLGAGLNGCSVLPEPVAPKVTGVNSANGIEKAAGVPDGPVTQVDLPEVVVIGTRPIDSPVESPTMGGGGGSPGGGSGGGGGDGGGQGPGGGGGDSGNTLPVAGDTPELQTFEYGYRARMSEAELVIYDGMSRTQQVSYLLNAQQATWLAEGIYPGPGLKNGNGDAFRHAFFSALNTKSFGAVLAKRLGDAHENRPNLTPEQQLEKQMDLHNNEQGRALAGSENLKGAIENMIASGSLNIIEGGMIVPSHP